MIFVDNFVDLGPNQTIWIKPDTQMHLFIKKMQSEIYLKNILRLFAHVPACLMIGFHEIYLFYMHMLYL